MLYLLRDGQPIRFIAAVLLGSFDFIATVRCDFDAAVGLEASAVRCVPLWWARLLRWASLVRIQSARFWLLSSADQVSIVPNCRKSAIQVCNCPGMINAAKTGNVFGTFNATMTKNAHE